MYLVLNDNTGRRFKSSATIFGEISPLWQKNLTLTQFFEGIFSIWQNFEPTWAKIYAIRQSLFVGNWQKGKHTLAIWSHCLITKRGQFH